MKKSEVFNEGYIQGLNAVSNALKDCLNESSRESRVIKALNGKNKRVKTFAIITAENPMGTSLSSKENKELQNRFLETLRLGKYYWYKVKGKYDNFENSLIVFNITEDAAVQYAREYNQKAVIWCEKTDEGMNYHLWERPDSKKLKRVETKTFYDNANDYDNFYTKISKNFKFSIPFDFYCESVTNERLDELIEESVDPTKTGSHKYRCRCAIKAIMKKMTENPL